MNTPRAKSKKKRRSRAIGLGPPPLRQVDVAVACARARLRAGETLRAVLRDLRGQADDGRLHPATPDHVAAVLRLDAKSPAALVLTTRHHDVLGVPAEIGEPDVVDAACAEILRLCRPSQFASPALRTLMEEVCRAARDAREFLFFGEVEPGDGRRDGQPEHFATVAADEAFIAAMTSPLPDPDRDARSA